MPPSEMSVQCGMGKDGGVSTTCRKIVQQIEFSVNGCKNFSMYKIIDHSEFEMTLSRLSSGFLLLSSSIQ